MSTNVRKTPGRYEPTGRTYDTWHCPHCDKDTGSAVWQGPDGEVGTYCTTCRQEGRYVSMPTVERPEQKWVRGLTEVRCCGEWLDCTGFTNTCDSCGADYNWSGQRLAPRSQWGEETGETEADIMSIDASTAEELLEGDMT